MLGLADQITHQWAIAVAQLSILCVFVYDCVAFIRWQPHHDAGQPQPPTPPAITPRGFIVRVSALAVCLLAYWLLTRNPPAVPRACMSPSYMDIALNAATCIMLAEGARQAHITVAFITPLFWIMGFVIVAPWNLWGYLVALIQGLRRLHPGAHTPGVIHLII